MRAAALAGARIATAAAAVALAHARFVLGAASAAALAHARLVLVAASAVALASGCRKAPPQDRDRALDRGDDAGAKTSPAGAWARDANAGAASHGAHATCRAISVAGAVRAGESATPNGDDDAASLDGDAGAPLLTGASVPEGAWLSLGDGARIVLKDPRTAREATFLGPARARGCVGRREEAWVAAGRFESSVGSGEVPGAEQWIVTPLGVVRYVAAGMVVEVGADAARIALGSGTAYVWAAEDARFRATPAAADAGATDPIEEPWRRTGAGTVRLLRATDRPAADRARASLDACSGRAHRAEELARRLLDAAGGDSGVPADGAIVAEQVRARRLARASCAVARLRVALLPPAEQEAATPILRDADDAWARVPTAQKP